MTDKKATMTTRRKAEWWDRRMMVYALLCFTAVWSSYGFIYHALAPDTSLMASGMSMLITASVTAILGYGAGRIVQTTLTRKKGDSNAYNSDTDGGS